MKKTSETITKRYNAKGIGEINSKAMSTKTKEKLQVITIKINNKYTIISSIDNNNQNLLLKSIINLI